MNDAMEAAHDPALVGTGWLVALTVVWLVAVLGALPHRRYGDRRDVMGHLVVDRHVRKPHRRRCGTRNRTAGRADPAPRPHPGRRLGSRRPRCRRGTPSGS